MEIYCVIHHSKGLRSVRPAVISRITSEKRSTDVPQPVIFLINSLSEEVYEML